MPVNDANCLMMSQQLLQAVKRLSTLEEKKTAQAVYRWQTKGRQTLTNWLMYYISKAGMETKSLTF